MEVATPDVQYDVVERQWASGLFHAIGYYEVAGLNNILGIYTPHPGVHLRFRRYMNANRIPLFGKGIGALATSNPGHVQSVRALLSHRPIDWSWVAGYLDGAATTFEPEIRAVYDRHLLRFLGEQACRDIIYNADELTIVDRSRVTVLQHIAGISTRSMSEL